MPANLTPQYYKAEEAYRQAGTPEEKLRCLEHMFAVMPKHKGTDHMQADLKRRIAQLRKRQERKHGARTQSFLVEKEGAAQIALLGGPNAGKSRLMDRLTNARAEVAPYPYTTQMPQPGMMRYEDVKLELVDLPPVTKDFLQPWQADAVRRADATLLVTDLGTDDLLDQVEVVLDRLQKMRIHLIHPDTPAREQDVLDPTVYRPTLLVANKCDLAGAGDRAEVLHEFYGERLPIMRVSAERGSGLEDLRAAVWRMLHMLRVYTKAPGKKADMADPYVLPVGSTVLDLGKHVHKELAASMKSARVWGGAKFDGQYVGRDYVLQDRDVVELHE